MHMRPRVTGALVLASAVLAAVAPTASARPAFSGDACKLLRASQVAALHIATACAQKRTTNAFATISSATWGKRVGHVRLAVWKVRNPAYIKLFESRNAKGKSAGVGDWSRAARSSTGIYSVIFFVVGNYAAELSISTATDHPLASKKPLVSLATTVAGRLR